MSTQVVVTLPDDITVAEALLLRPLPVTQEQFSHLATVVAGVNDLIRPKFDAAVVAGRLRPPPRPAGPGR